MKRIFILLNFFCLTGVANILYAQEVKINTNLAIEADGTVRMDGAATVWDDLRVPLTEPSIGKKTIPEWNTFPYGNSGAYPYINWFRATGIDEMYFVVQLPHDWAEGTEIRPHIHWVPSANGASGPTVPRWGLQYTWAVIGEVFPAYVINYGATTNPTEVLVKDKHYFTSLGSITGTGKKISSMLVCRIFRDGDNGADTYTGLAGALEVGFHYQRNTMGSREELTK